MEINAFNFYRLSNEVRAMLHVTHLAQELVKDKKTRKSSA